MAKKNADTQAEKGQPVKRQQRSKIAQTRVPSILLDEALRIAKTLGDNFAYKPTKPINIAKALNLTPTSGSFALICGASIGYGLTEGSNTSETIGLTKLGLRIVRPIEENDVGRARKEAVLKPSIIHEFLSRYEDAAFPRDDIAKNVLREMDIPEDRIEDVFEMIIKNAENEGLFKQIKEKRYVSFDHADQIEDDSDVSESGEDETIDEDNVNSSMNNTSEIITSRVSNTSDKRDKKKVFISHGKNRDFIDPIKKLLSFGELEAVVSVQQASVSIPVPDKVINDMRLCGAAIIHINTEEKLLDKEAQEHIIINANVLIEIGAAMALYGRRFILLVEDGITLPSNLQGLFVVKYKGQSLDGDATIRLLESIRDIKTNELP